MLFKTKNPLKFSTRPTSCNISSVISEFCRTILQLISGDIGELLTSFQLNQVRDAPSVSSLENWKTFLSLSPPLKNVLSFENLNH